MRGLLWEMVGCRVHQGKYKASLEPLVQLESKEVAQKKKEWGYVNGHRGHPQRDPKGQVWNNLSHKINNLELNENPKEKYTRLYKYKQTIK